jgi:hypothetical protein
MLSFGGLVEHECPRCRRPVQLPLGALCDVCRREIEARASRLARSVAGGTTVLLALYVWWRMPPDPVPMQQMVGAIGVVVWYLLTYLVVRRSSRELIK